MNVILLGPPGSGKGTQSYKLVEKYQLSHISTGDILRSQISTKTQLGTEAKKYMDKGELVPDNLIIEMVSSTTSKLPSILLDGFPRTINQALALEKEMEVLNKKIDVVLYFEVPFEDLIQRLSQRISCKTCSKTFSKSDKEFICLDECTNQDLYQREDDKPEAVSKRMETYKELTEPLLEFYEKKNLLKKVNANSSIQEVSLEIDKILQ
ncbi:MAG: adenylate kinase [Chloroflexota bacterium]|nr:adenylate kinase [Chloroflexota bacterium]